MFKMTSSLLGMQGKRALPATLWLRISLPAFGVRAKKGREFLFREVTSDTCVRQQPCRFGGNSQLSTGFVSVIATESLGDKPCYQSSQRSFPNKPPHTQPNKASFSETRHPILIQWSRTLHSSFETPGKTTLNIEKRKKEMYLQLFIR